MRLAPGDEVVFEITSHKQARIVLFKKMSPPPVFANGTLTRNLDLSKAGVEFVAEVNWPYVVTGGELSFVAAPGAKVSVAIAADGKKFDPVGLVIRKTNATALLGPWFAARKDAIYSYKIRLKSEGGVPLSKAAGNVQLTTLFQFAPRALPKPEAGVTKFDLTVATPDGAALPADWRGMDIIHEWSEILGETPPK